MNRIFFNKKNLFFYTCWWLFWATIQYVLISEVITDNKIAAVDALASNLLLGLLCLFPVNNFRYYIPQKQRVQYIFTISLLLTGLWLLICNTLLHRIYHSNTNYLTFYDHTRLLRSTFAFLHIAFLATISMAWYSALEKHEEDTRKTAVNKIANDAELFNLRQQLQPHFLFNSLNSISALITIEPKEAKHMIILLSDFLRGTIRREDRKLITFKEEMHYLNLYFEIEKVRFGSRLETVVELNEDTENATLPALILQPILENAIKYGLYGTLDNVIISLHATNHPTYLQIEISNPFDKDSQMQGGTGFGLNAIRRRLYLLYGRNDLLSIQNQGQEFKVQIQIPQEK